MANSEDSEQSDLGLHCLPKSVCPKLRVFTVHLTSIINILYILIQCNIAYNFRTQI